MASGSRQASSPRPPARPASTSASPRLTLAAGPARPRPRRARRPREDEFGLDPAFRERALSVVRVLYHRYWRVETRGLRNVPRRGAAILVANHSGTLPFDAVMIACALEEHAHPRPARFLYDRFVDNLPWIPDLYRRAGGVVASPANAERLLEQGALVGLFPEGVAGLSKLYSERYVLQPFSTGFVRLALRHRVPIVPVAVVGAEEIYPLVGRSAALGKLIGAPYVPLTPFFPLLGPLGAIPLPSKWTIRFGKPVVLEAPRRGRTDGTAVRAMAESVRRRVRRMLRTELAVRTSRAARARGS